MALVVFKIFPQLNVLILNCELLTCFYETTYGTNSENPSNNLRHRFDPENITGTRLWF
jgi:hypothetical protein